MSSDPKFDKFRIHSGVYWDTYVSEDGGSNLGRIYFWLWRDGTVDRDQLTPEESDELDDLTALFSPVLRKLFSPDGPLNWAYLANNEGHRHHCHYHLVPRYKGPREFEGVTFIDRAWSKQWESLRMGDDLAIKVGEKIMSAVILPA